MSFPFHSLRRCVYGAILLLAGVAGQTTSAQPGGDRGELATDAAKWRLYEQYALTHQGDPARGAKLFRDEQRTKCLTCHRVGEEGGNVGPDLTHIGGKFDRPHLIESVLEPSRQFVEGYRTTVIVTLDGQIETGIVKEESDQELVLVGADAKQRVIALSEIDERQTSSVSMMPEGLYDALSTADFTDLVAYLETLRPGGKPTPGAGLTGPIQLPAGFEVRSIATGLTGLTALETLPDGRILVCEQTGAVRVIKDGKLLEEPFVTLPVDDNWERGVIGVTVHPEFPKVPYVYICYVAKEPYPHHHVSRFTADGDVAVPGSEEILLVGDDQTKLGGHVPAGHQGGALHFGTDGKLYIAIGEQTAGKPAQRLDSLLGKMLRINPDGSIPKDNPFYEETTGKYRSIWALGFRNPYSFAIHSETGEMLINDIGGEYEDINRGVAGANYGWPIVDHGPTDDERFHGPVHHYPHASAVGGDFLEGESSWPRKYQGRYFFADYIHGWIKTLDPANPEKSTTFATGLRRPSDLRFAPDGSLYVLLRNAWVIDGRFYPNTGTVLQIRFAGGNEDGETSRSTAAGNVDPSAKAALGLDGIQLQTYVQIPGQPEFGVCSEGPVWQDGTLFLANRPFVRVSEDRTAYRYLDLHVAGTMSRGNGAILLCDNSHKALLDLTPEGNVFVVADGYQDQPLRSLNDVTADAKGNVYWTDPKGSSLSNRVGRVFRVAPDGTVTLMADGLAFPNGLEVDPTSEFLYVVESQTRRVLRYELPQDDSPLGEPSVFFEFGESSKGGDGCTLDTDGNLWVAEYTRTDGNGRLVVLSPEGTLLGEVPVPAELVTNVTFGGPDRTTLFVSTGKPSGAVYAKTSIQGFPGHPVNEIPRGKQLQVREINEVIKDSL